MAVSNYLNFTRAAEQLRITQPAISHQINTLENELGVKLFHRTQKRVQLTQEGYLFTQYATAILTLAQTSKNRLKEKQRISVTRFGIGCHSMPELSLLVPVLKTLRKEIPTFLPVLRMIPSESLENLLKDGDIQVMLLYQESAPKQTTFRELTQRPIVCICGEEHPFAVCESLTIPQLCEGERLAVCPPHCTPQSVLRVQSRVIADCSSEQLCFCDGLETVYATVASGSAYAIIADLPQVPLPGIRAIPLAGTTPLSYGLAYYAGETSHVLHRFLDETAALFQ